MEQRICGGCTACCKTHGVFQLSKDPGKWCFHCDIGKGCKIYSERPTSCQEFKCSWLVGLGFPEYRPDKTRIVPEHRNIPDLGLVLWLFEVSEGSLDSKFAKRQTRLNLEVGNPVLHMPLAGAPKLYLPRGKVRPKPGLAFRMDSDEREVEIIPFVPGRF